jgi:glutamine synthetase
MSNRASTRLKAVATASKRKSLNFDRAKSTDDAPLMTSDYFGCNTFSHDLMDKHMDPKDVKTLRRWATGNRKVTPELADNVASAVKAWALSRGATHYSHWFQPQTGATAEKHDAFFSLNKDGRPIEKFTGTNLIQAEPDASSFPSGGVRETFEARGYTAWDASSPMFLMETNNGLTLCIPSVFVSYGGEALDQKTPLLRSIKKLSETAVESLKLLGEESSFVAANCGPEQEYFLTDESLYFLRPDLLLTGRTLVGRTPPKHQQLDDHYFGAVKPRVLNCMMEAEHELYKLGVPCKTRHNEVAPAQYEMAPIFENANVAADHNQLVMEVIKQVARKHGLVASFHEKPFANINGSGKHVNWSLSTSKGQNLLEPGDNPEQNVRFLYFLTACIKAVHEHGGLIRASVASAGNDFRLGANEAPPAIMSVFLGNALSEVVDGLIGKSSADVDHPTEINLDLARVPLIARDNTDRNRTSPFAFTGNKFEFRAVGSSASISTPLMVINAAVSDALVQMNEALSAKSGGGKATDSQALEVITQFLKASDAARFDGDNYSQEWHMEAEKRGLLNLKNTPEALTQFIDPKTKAMLAKHDILSETESNSRYNVQLERYITLRVIEMSTLEELLRTHVIPAATAHQTQLAASIDAVEEVLDEAPKEQLETLKELGADIAKVLLGTNALRALINECEASEDHSGTANKLATDGMALMEDLLKLSNSIELKVDDDLWSLPKFRELLYLI